MKKKVVPFISRSAITIIVVCIAVFVIGVGYVHEALTGNNPFINTSHGVVIMLLSASVIFFVGSIVKKK